ncbi:MAG: hypothetical protein AAF368_00505 [Planctomycetota bacterium]
MAKAVRKKATRKKAAAPARKAPEVVHDRDALRGPRGHEVILDGLWRAARADRLSHAFGFFGPAGVGKFLAARHFAMGLFCRGEGEERPSTPCGECGSCKRFLAGAHPDFHVLDPISLGLEQIPVAGLADREGDSGKVWPSHLPSVESFLRLRAAEGGRRVVVLRDFDRAVAPGQNALLKTLEEPGPDVCILVESSSPDALLPTVRSRVVDVPFVSLAEEDAAQVLLEKDFSQEEAARWSQWSRGAPGRALELKERGAEEMRRILVKAATEGSPYQAQAAWILVENDQPGDSPARKLRAKSRLFLELGLDVLRDVTRAQSDPARASLLAHAEVLPVLLGRVQSPAGEKRLRRAIDALLVARRDIDLNLTPESAVERALLTLSDLAPGGAAISPSR